MDQMSGETDEAYQARMLLLITEAKQWSDAVAAAAKKKAEDAKNARLLAIEQQRQQDEAAAKAADEERIQRREKIFSGERALLTMAADWRAETENGKMEVTENKIALLLSHLTDLLATCITQQEDIHSLDDALAQVSSRLQQLDQRPVAAPDASSSNTSDCLEALEVDVGSLKNGVQLQQTATQQLEQRITKIKWDDLKAAWHKRFQVEVSEIKAMDKLMTLEQGTLSSVDWLAEYQRLTSVPYIQMGFKAVKHYFISRSWNALACKCGSHGQLPPADSYRPGRLRRRSAVYYSSSAPFDPVPSGDGQVVPGYLRLRAARRNRPIFLRTVAVTDSSPTNLSSDPRVVWLLDEFTDIFESSTGVVPDRPISHEIIPRAGAVTPKGCICRMSEEELTVLRAQLDDLLDKGWIRPCSSSYGAPLLFVRKKNKDLHLCINYRKLNVQTVKNAGPLPRIDDLLERLGDTKYFCKLDLKSGYHQISIRPNDRYKSAFRTWYGHFEWVVMPFGLTNAPATFQAAMTNEFRAMLDRFVLVYLDDILVYSRTLDDHLEHLRRVLETLCGVQYKANHDKCESVRQELEYWGHYFTPAGINPLSDKIQAIQEWPEPWNVKDVHSFLGLASYYQHFIKGYSKIAAHLTKLQCENRSFDFGEDARESFLTLKAALLSAEVLRIYDPLLPTRVNTDASGYGIGAVLEQHDGVDWHPVEYFSKKVPVVHSIDDAHKKELLAFVHALKQWRHFLLGRSQFRCVTDNNPLVFYKTQDTVNSTIARWMAFIDQFDFFPDHIPGKSDRFADALSRRPNHCTAVYSTFEIGDELWNNFIRGYQADPSFATRKDKVVYEEEPEGKQEKKSQEKLMQDAMKSAKKTPEKLETSKKEPEETANREEPAKKEVAKKEEGERPKRKEKVKMKLPITYNGKRGEHLLLWIVEIQTYGGTAPMEPKSQVAFTTSCLGEVAKECVLSEAKAAGFEDIGEWAKTMSLREFLQKIKERFLDKTTTDKAFDELTTIGQKRWSTVDALSCEVDWLLQVPGLNLQDNQVLYIFSRTLLEPIHGHLVSEAKSDKYNYRQFRDLALQREQTTVQVKGTYASVVRSGPSGGYGNGRRVMWRQKRQGHTLVVFNDEIVEKIPLDEAEGGVSGDKYELLDEEAALAANEVSAAVAANKTRAARAWEPDRSQLETRLKNALVVQQGAEQRVESLSQKLRILCQEGMDNVRTRVSELDIAELRGDDVIDKARTQQPVQPGHSIHSSIANLYIRRTGQKIERLGSVAEQQEGDCSTSRASDLVSAVHRAQQYSRVSSATAAAGASVTAVDTESPGSCPALPDTRDGNARDVCNGDGPSTNSSVNAGKKRDDSNGSSSSYQPIQRERGRMGFVNSLLTARGLHGTVTITDPVAAGDSRPYRPIPAGAAAVASTNVEGGHSTPSQNRSENGCPTSEKDDELSATKSSAQEGMGDGQAGMSRQQQGLKLGMKLNWMEAPTLFTRSVQWLRSERSIVQQVPRASDQMRMKPIQPDLVEGIFVHD
ncbi:hypothetical protein CBR_g64848 [Chara braunii]|uniref:Reverse transcriptase domain-containing protein n=1 Tax=Chara braunii TaxID=69332 RepID=A0A388K973_CHABU|nr:hypothetical protein CBR_g64848 [Chara braunii]|eukprot:GBG66576.1 hypothetical protein CBR_g64848 [Chara braunii]